MPAKAENKTTVVVPQAYFSNITETGKSSLCCQVDFPLKNEILSDTCLTTNC